MQTGLFDVEIKIPFRPVEFAQADCVIFEVPLVEQTEIEKRDPVQPGVLIHDAAFQFGFRESGCSGEYDPFDFLFQIFLDPEFHGYGTVFFRNEAGIDFGIVVSAVRVEFAQGVGGVDQTFVVQHSSGCDSDLFPQLVGIIFFIADDLHFFDDGFRSNAENKVDRAVRIFFGFGDDIGKEAGGVQTLDVVIYDPFVINGAFSALNVHAEYIVGKPAAVRLFKSNGFQFLCKCRGAAEKTGAKNGQAVFFHVGGRLLLFYSFLTGMSSLSYRCSMQRNSMS